MFFCTSIRQLFDTYANWDLFSVKNKDKRTAFEYMCRDIFKYQFFDEVTVFHDDHNNPGVEILPAYSKKVGKVISFQAKFFEKEVDWNQILHSMKVTVEKYTGNLEIVYLYCNKTISIGTKDYNKVYDVLKKSNIELILITNREILSAVERYNDVLLKYFDEEMISSDWYVKQVNDVLDDLGDRYDKILNISTKSSDAVSLFLCDIDGARYINSKKEALIEDIKHEIQHSDEYMYILLLNELEQLTDVSSLSMHESFLWYDSKCQITDVLTYKKTRPKPCCIIN